MNEETDETEALLRRWEPRAPRDEVVRRVSLDLECSPPRLRWWQRLGFTHPAAALGWGLAVPALLVCALPGRQPAGAPNPAPALPVATSKQSAPGRMDLRPVTATNRRYETTDDGVVLDRTERPVRRTRYRSEDTIAWRDNATGALLEFSYPREDVVLVPVTTR